MKLGLILGVVDRKCWTLYRQKCWECGHPLCSHRWRPAPLHQGFQMNHQDFKEMHKRSCVLCRCSNAVKLFVEGPTADQQNSEHVTCLVCPCCLYALFEYDVQTTLPGSEHLAMYQDVMKTDHSQPFLWVSAFYGVWFHYATIQSINKQFKHSNPTATVTSYTGRIRTR